MDVLFPSVSPVPRRGPDTRLVNEQINVFYLISPYEVGRFFFAFYT